jgi:excisionase family DNA binding protein
MMTLSDAWHVLTLNEAAQHLGKSQRQVRYMVKAGQIKARRLGGAVAARHGCCGHRARRVRP